MSPKTLYGWKQKEAESSTTPDEHNRRILELEREVSEVRKANEILKKAMGFVVR